MEMFQKEFQAFKALRKGNPNIVRAFNAKLVNPSVHFTTLDKKPLIES